MVEVGQQAPEFALKDQNNQVVSLADLRGVKNVVLVFYPYAFTRVCAGELCAIRDDLASFENDDVQVLTVSVDTPYAHKVWAEREGFTFPLLADFWPHGAVSQAYGCFDAVRGCSTRGTYVIDRAGVVRWLVVNAIPDARDQAEYLTVLAGV
ncbi:MAG: mycoredoxin-dependent peroxiredoxin [Frankiaceae bacterium]|jgi:peroxiredoxin|nr:mycoredoxin-dependent peroxiredoxin [Frankiaceae bacterium]